MRDYTCPAWAVGTLLRSQDRLSEFAAQRTCQKRQVLCVLFDRDGTPQCYGVNACTPPVDGCPRLQETTTQGAYPLITPCQSRHAEMAALEYYRIQRAQTLTTAVIIGHDFPCPPCERALGDAGFEHIYTIPHWSDLIPL